MKSLIYVFVVFRDIVEYMVSVFAIFLRRVADSLVVMKTWIPSL